MCIFALCLTLNENNVYLQKKKGIQAYRYTWSSGKKPTVDNRQSRFRFQLDYIEQVLLKSLWEHRHAWPFQQPVDTKALNLYVSWY